MTPPSSESANVWVIRGKRSGDFEERVVATSKVGVAMPGIPDASAVGDRDGIEQLVKQSLPGEPGIAVTARQLASLRLRIEIGDYIILAHQKQRSFSFGTVVGDYQFVPDGKEPLRHSRPVKWVLLRAPRKRIDPALLRFTDARPALYRIRWTGAAACVKSLVESQNERPAPVAQAAHTPPPVATALTRKHWVPLVGAAVSIVGVLLVLWALRGFPNLQNAEVVVGGKDGEAFRVKVENGKTVDPSELLESVWSTPWMHDAIVAKLQRDGYYRLSDLPEREMKIVLQTLWANDAWKRELFSRVKTDGGFFTKEDIPANYGLLMKEIFGNPNVYRSARWQLTDYELYYLQDPRLAKALTLMLPVVRDTNGIINYESMKAKVAENPVISALREAAFNQQPPFQPIARPVRASMPSAADQPPAHCCVVAANSDLVSRFVKIYNRSQTRYLILSAGLSFKDAPNITTEIHLNSKQIHYLINDGITNSSGIENLFVLPLGADGHSEDSTVEPEKQTVEEIGGIIADRRRMRRTVGR
jgi:hypothetical protein